MRRTVEFLVEAGKWGMASEITAILSFGVGTWEHFHDRPISSYILISVSVPLFWLGAMAAWNKTRIELETERNKNKKPEIRGSILAVFWDFEEDASGDLDIGFLRFFVYIRIVNWRDVPTTIRSYSLQILMNGVSYEAKGDPDFGLGEKLRHESPFSNDASELDRHDKHTVTPIVPIAMRVHSASPLRYSIEQDGWISFLIKGPFDFRAGIPASSSISINIRDSLDGDHRLVVEKMPIYHAALQ